MGYRLLLLYAYMLIPWTIFLPSSLPESQMEFIVCLTYLSAQDRQPFPSFMGQGWVADIPPCNQKTIVKGTSGSAGPVIDPSPLCSMSSYR